LKAFCGRLFRMLATVALVSATTAQLARALTLPDDPRTTSGSTATTTFEGSSSDAGTALQTSPSTPLSSSEVSTTTTTTGGCAGQVLERPFVRWLDPAKYVLAPGGSLESTTGWKLSGGAKLVSGNESFRVHSATDNRSLALPSGSSATTKAMCVATLYPTLRLFALNSGSLLSTLKVEAIFSSALGQLTVQVGLLSAPLGWQPTLPMLYAANFTTLPILTDGTTTVRFRFTPQGAGSGWRIDDVYVDPYKGR
jgi:hypothetical protein